METSLEQDSLKPRRAPFLTLLCILTFIISGFNLITNIASTFKAKTIAHNAAYEMEEMREDFEEGFLSLEGMEEFEGQFDALIDQMQASLQFPTNLWMTLLYSLGYLLTFSGALFMFRLIKLGYKFYIVGCVVLLLTPLALLGMNMFAIGTASLQFFSGGLFIILYYFALKQSGVFSS